MPKHTRSDDEAHDHGSQAHAHGHQAAEGKSRRRRFSLPWGKPKPGHQNDVAGHTHDALISYATATEKGIWALKWSFAGLMATALFQVVVVVITGSVALLADTIHNFTDAGITIPLWIAFLLARRKPSDRFTYGYGRAEDLAGVAIVLAILFSAIFAGYESIQRLFDPQEINFLWAVVAASLIGFMGNEAVAMFRIKVGRRIGSIALVADGHHARVDGLTSLAVFFSAIGVWLGYPLADPAIGLLISVLIIGVAWQSGKPVFLRLLDGIDPQIVVDIRHAVGQVPGVHTVTDIRARWLGHRLHAELSIVTDHEDNVDAGHEVAKEARHQLLHQMPHLTSVNIHVDPVHAAGEDHHLVDEHAHGDLPPHSHGAQS